MFLCVTCHCLCMFSYDYPTVPHSLIHPYHFSSSTLPLHFHLLAMSTSPPPLTSSLAIPTTVVSDTSSTPTSCVTSLLDECDKQFCGKTYIDIFSNLNWDNPSQKIYFSALDPIEQCWPCKGGVVVATVEPAVDQSTLVSILMTEHVGKLVRVKYKFLNGHRFDLFRTAAVEKVTASVVKITLRKPDCFIEGTNYCDYIVRFGSSLWKLENGIVGTDPLKWAADNATMLGNPTRDEITHIETKLDRLYKLVKAAIQMPTEGLVGAMPRELTQSFSTTGALINKKRSLEIEVEAAEVHKGEPSLKKHCSLSPSLDDE